MKKLILFSMLLIACFLVAQFYDPIQVNEDLNPVFYRGNSACKIIGDATYITFVEDSTSANLYFSYSEDGINFSNTLIDYGVFLGKNTEPTIEVLPDGKIIIFYIKKAGDVYYMYKAESINNGTSFGPEIITTGVMAFSTFQDNGEIYISYEKGDIFNLSNFLYFTNYEESENHDVIKFWGPDRLTGPVHCNEDIWIQQAGGGTNNGFPTFYGLVTTAGRARLWPQGIPMKESGLPWEDIFRGGLLEEVDGVENITFAPNANELRANATQIAGHDIVYAKLMGNSFQLMYGDIQNLGTHEFEVYSWYPDTGALANQVVNMGGNWFEDTDNIWTNQITLYDTIWSNGGTFGVGPSSAFWVTDAELWIEGEVSNKMTWGCADTIHIVGDITYTNTPVGQYPDGFSGIDPVTGLPVYNGLVNQTDYFGLVSEQKILIQYKHRDPFEDFIIRDDNCDGVYLYGAYAAIAEGDTAVYGNMASYYDGAITFQYQHGHGSTPSFWAPSPYPPFNDTLYTYIDFHKYIFPINSFPPPIYNSFQLHGNEPAPQYGTCGFPYEDPGYINLYPNNGPDYAVPYGTDYPWYNPVWPEPSTDIVWERGELHVYGTLAQRRRGFVHRSGIDPSNHSPDNLWDLENHLYDGTHPSSGYDKNYNYDARFLYEQPPYFPNLNNSQFSPTHIISRSSDGGDNFEELNSENLPYYFGTDYSSIKAEGNLIAVVSQRNEQLRLKYSMDNGISFDLFEYSLINKKIIDTELKNELIYFLAYDMENNLNNVIYKFDPNTSVLTGNNTFPPAAGLCDFGIANDDSRVYAYLQDYSSSDVEILFNYSEGFSSIFSQEYMWQTSFSMNNAEDSRLFVNFNQHDSVYVSILNSLAAGEESGDLWLAKGHLPGLLGTDDLIVEKPVPTVTNYPNPFNPSTTISFNLSNEQNEPVELNIYNMKGQKVKDLSPSLCHPEFIEGRGENEYSVVWNGKDQTGKPVSSGIYFYKLKSGKFEKTKKMLLMK
jgi:hypothetical protein